MTFLNSALLAGLAAAIIPILIHLFSRRRYPIVNFSSLRFLRKLQRHQMRRLRLRQLLLLLLRTLAILLIAFAFTRPTLTERLGIGTLSSGRLGVAIIIDGSASMQAKGADGAAFQRAISTAKILISMMHPGDRTILILAKDKPQLLIKQPSGDGSALLQALDEAKPWDGSTDLPAALKLANEMLSSVQEFRSEIFIISDFAAPAEISEVPQNTALFFVPIDPRSVENLGIEEVRVISEIIEPGQPVDIEVKLTNYGLKDRDDVYYSIFLNGIRVGEDVVSLVAGGEIIRQHQVQPEVSGLQQGLIQIEEGDALTVDNRAYFCFAVPALIRVLLVGDETSAREIKLALGSASGDDDLIHLETTGSSRWDSRQISKFDVIIFSDPPTFTQSQTARLINFVQNSGGLMLIPSVNTDIANMNREFLSKIGSTKWGEKIGQHDLSESFLTWDDLKLDSPLFKGIVRPGNRPSSPKFYQALTIINHKGNAPITFENGSPFLAEIEFGQGRVMLTASSPLKAWSDWAQRGIFAPLFHRMVLRLANSSQEKCVSLHAGEELQVRTGVSSNATADLIFPDGLVYKIPVETSSDKARYSYNSIDPSGIYQLNAGMEAYLAAVNPPRIESDLKRPDLRDLYSALFEADATLCPPQLLAETVLSSRYGRELWKIALILGLVLLLAESLIGSVWRKSLPSNNVDPRTEATPT